MIGILSFLAVVSGIIFVVAVVLLAVKAMQKKPKKPFVVMAGASAVAFIALFVGIANIYVPTKKPATKPTLSTSVSSEPVHTSPSSSKESKNSEPSEPESTDALAESVPMKTSEPTNTPKSTNTPKPTNTPEPTDTPRPTNTPKTTNTPKPKSTKKQQTTKKASKLKFDDKLITKSTIKDMTKYDYIKDVYIEIKEDKKEINIVVQVPSATDIDVAKMAGEDTARYLASLAAFANDYYKVPGVDFIGSLFDRYSLLLYIDDGYGSFNIYGAKVPTAKNITWRY